MWVKHDDNFDEDPKILAAGFVCAGLLTASQAYANRNLTDGYLPRAAVARLLSARLPVDGRERWEACAARMVETGLWDVAPGGWRVHEDYQKDQPTKAEMIAKRLKTAEKVREWRAAQSQSNPGGNQVCNPVTAEVTNLVSNPKRNPVRNQESNRVSNGFVTGGVTVLPIPIPIPDPDPDPETRAYTGAVDKPVDNLPMPTQIPRSARVSSGRAASKGKPDKPEGFRSALLWFTEAYRRRYGREYTVLAADENQLGRLLERLSPDEYAALQFTFARYVADTDEGIMRVSGGHSLKYLCATGYNRYNGPGLLSWQESRRREAREHEARKTAIRAAPRHPAVADLVGQLAAQVAP